MKKLIIFLCSGFLLICGVINSNNSSSASKEGPSSAVSFASLSESSPNKKTSTPSCDGTTVTSNCLGDDGILYEKYLFHEAVPEQTETVEHPAEPAQTHIITHEAVYNYETVNVGCVRANMGKYAGSCALSQCSDDAYSGASGRGSCSYHGGVARSGGPWYIYEERPVLVSPAWDEEIVDVPAKEAWTETIIIAPAAEAYIEKVLAE